MNRLSGKPRFGPQWDERKSPDLTTGGPKPDVTSIVAGNTWPEMDLNATLLLLHTVHFYERIQNIDCGHPKIILYI